MEKETKEIKKNFGEVKFPFVKLKVDNKQFFNKGLDKKKDEIKIQTQKLISCYENFQEFKKKEIKKINNFSLKHKFKSSSPLKRQLRQCYLNLGNNGYSPNKNNNKEKRNNINVNADNNYPFLKEKYKNYINKLKAREENKNISNLNESNKSNKDLTYSNISNNLSLELNRKYSCKFLFNRKRIKMMKLNNIEEKKNNNNKTDLYIGIKKLSNNDDIYSLLKRKNEKLSKLNLILRETNDKNEEILGNLKKFNEDSRKNSPKTFRKMKSIINEDIKDNKNGINLKKILNSDRKGKNNDTYTRINLDKKKFKQNYRNNFSFIKKSTADLIQFWQSLEPMPDDYFYRERKRFINKYPSLQKEAHLTYKRQGNFIDQHQENYNNIVENKLKKYIILQIII